MPKPRKTTIVLVIATLVAVGYIMFVPARNYMDQQAATDDAEAQLAQLDAEVADLEQRQVELQDPEQIEQVARERFNLGYPGEEVFAVLPGAAAAAADPHRLALRRPAGRGGRVDRRPRADTHCHLDRFAPPSRWGVSWDIRSKPVDSFVASVT